MEKKKKDFAAELEEMKAKAQAIIDTIADDEKFEDTEEVSSLPESDDDMQFTAIMLKRKKGKTVKNKK